VLTPSARTTSQQRSTLPAAGRGTVFRQGSRPWERKCSPAGGHQAPSLPYADPLRLIRELTEACQAARIWALISSLPDGLDTIAGDRGYRFSGGEKQRLALARLLLKAPSVVVLDEATAHLDSESEAAIQRALATALAGRTSLVIAHRLYGRSWTHPLGGPSAAGNSVRSGVPVSPAPGGGGCRAPERCAAWLDVMTGRTSKLTRSAHRARQASSSSGLSVSMSWKHRFSRPSSTTQLSMYRKPSGSMRPCLAARS
jgi:hypothetical protein